MWTRITTGTFHAVCWHILSHKSCDFDDTTRWDQEQTCNSFDIKILDNNYKVFIAFEKDTGEYWSTVLAILTYFQRFLLLQIWSRCSIFLAHKHLVNVSNIFGLSGIKSFSYLWEPLNFEFVGDFRHFPGQFYPMKTKRYLKSDENY